MSVTLKYLQIRQYRSPSINFNTDNNKSILKKILQISLILIINKSSYIKQVLSIIVEREQSLSLNL